MEAKAIKKTIRMSPRKMRLVVDLIRGQKADTALSVLRFQTKHAAAEAEQVLKSAISNLNQKADAEGYRVRDNEIVIKKAFVDKGLIIYRRLAGPRGTAFRIRKRTCHLTIIVGTNEEEKA